MYGNRRNNNSGKHINSLTICFNILIVIFLTTIISCTSLDNNADSYDGIIFNEITFVGANRDKGFNYGYYYYVPQSIIDSPNKFIFVEPLNSPNNTNSVSQLRSAALRIVRRNIENANLLNFAILVPIYGFRASSSETMHVWPLCRETLLLRTGNLARVDLQLISMIDDLKERSLKEEFELEPKILISGFSSSGRFAIRFSAIHPELIQAVAAGGLAITILPLADLNSVTLNYPIGIADLYDITGESFNSEAFNNIPKFIYIGSQDNTNDPVRGPAYGGMAINQIHNLLGANIISRFNHARMIYEQQGTAAQFRIYEGVGHVITDQMRIDIREFLAENM